ncbi:MAG TPA: ribonuclease H-like domain-containing protein [Polyangiaceae bacterium]
MDLKRRLSQLPAPAAARGFAGAAPVLPSDRGELLAALRAKMADILEQPRPEPRPPADPSAGLLPFVREERATGVLYRRSLRLAPSHHVGRVPVDAARGARPELLSLLALDTLLAGTRPERALYLDTETTGLGTGSGIWPFLVGLGRFDEDGYFEVEQLLLRSPADEPALVAHVRERVESAELLVSYNGKTFDWPLLATRAVMCRVRPLPARPHLDLLHVARRLHRERLGACRLVTLESEVLGFVRGPDIEGGEVPARYAHFLRTGDEEALLAVVEHNAWDVASMAALVGLYGEPFDLLHPEDLLGLATTLKRAGALAVAERAADTALDRGAGARALRVRGSIAKAQGDRSRALADFEAFSNEIDDPAVRLELAKLYEHFVKEPSRALALTERGTGEPEAALAKRRARLERKARR